MQPKRNFLLLALALFSIGSWAELRPMAFWHMLPVSTDSQQADAHLLISPQKATLLLDAGDPGGKLVGFLKKKGIQKLDAILVTHFHRDHYEGILPLLEAGIKVGKVYINFPPQKTCEAEKPWGCHWEDVASLASGLAHYKVPTVSMMIGDVLLQGGTFELKVMAVFDGVHSPVGATDINDMSPLIRLKYGKISFLFTGDLNHALGEYFAKEKPEWLKAHVLKVPHHGAEQTAPNSFFEVVSPEVALVPAPRSVFESARGEKVRNWLKTKRVATYVSGINGEVVVNTDGLTYTVQTENRDTLWSNIFLSFQKALEKLTRG